MLGALLLGTIGFVPALAQVAPPVPATKAAMEKRTAARTLLSSSLARIAANSSDTAALLDAGRASIDLEDYRAALGFLVRAEQARPRDGRSEEQTSELQSLMRSLYAVVCLET